MEVQMKLPTASLLALLFVFLSACTPNRPFRTESSDSPCLVSTESTRTADCDNRIWERAENDYDVFYVEFDDMGLLHPKGSEGVGEAWNQIEYIMQKLVVLARERGISLVVYVHGWKHNASAEDENVKLFHKMLKSISLVE
jgi:hypothetical protein